MSEQADFYVLNKSQETIQVKHQLGENPPFTYNIPPDGDETIIIPDLNSDVTIDMPTFKEDKKSFLKTKTDTALITHTSLANRTWLINIDQNDLPPQAPTTVNVEIGEDE